MGGNVGRQYVSQIIAHKYANIVFVVDAQAHPLNGFMHGVKTISSISFFENIHKYSYDYLIVCIADDHERENIAKQLLEHGLEQDKLISTISYYDSVKLINDVDLVKWFHPTFSWYGEDLVIKGLFNMSGINEPSYLDIGCNHPYEGNNTALLYLTGS